MTKITRSLLVGLGLILSCSAFANKKIDDNTPAYQTYQTVHVSISNHMSIDCSRTNVYHPYGKLVDGNTFPYEIDKNDTATFILREGMATGPDVTLTYRCGADTFTVRAWQSQCWLGYGCDAHGEIISKTNGITVDEPVDTKNASRYWNEYGQVHFTVRSK